MRQLRHQEPQLTARIQSRLYDAEPDAEPLTERLHGSLDQLDDCTEAATGRKPESRYQHVNVTESKHSNVVKLEPSAGPTLFLI